MRITTRLTLIIAGSAMLDVPVSDVALSHAVDGCTTHKHSSARPALSTSRHHPVIPRPRPTECLANTATPPSPSMSPTPAEPSPGSPTYTPAEPQDGEGQGYTNAPKLCANAMHKLGVEHWFVSSWLSLPYASLGYLVVTDTPAKNGDNRDTIQEVSLSRQNADEEATKEAIGVCRAAAEQGDTLAQFSLGDLYATGSNYAEAAKWFRKTADQGLAGAEYNLGLLYGAGEGVPQNTGEAAKWTRLAAEQGLADAQYHLGRMYSEGLGVPYDLIQAHMWLNLAGAQGYGDAIKQRDIVAVWIGSTTEIAEAERLAAAWSPTVPRLAGEYQPKQ